MSAQDLPPPGGFASINVERTLPKPFIRATSVALILAGLTINGLIILREAKRRLKVMKIEQGEHFIAAQPFLYAEQERKFLLHLRNLREEEKELMKNVPGWKYGTLYGEPIFKTLPKDTLPPIQGFEYTAHRPTWEWYDGILLPDKYQ